MRKETLARLGGLAFGAAVLVAVALFAFARDGGTAAAQGGPSMGFLLQGGGYPIGDCTQDCMVKPGEGFFVSIVADPPAEGYTGFQTELFHGGLHWNFGQCEDQVMMEPLGLCLGPVIPQLGPTHKPLPSTSIGYGGVTALGASPPVSHSTTLVQARYTCPEEGTYEMTLAAQQSEPIPNVRPKGSWFIGAGGEEISPQMVGTRTLRVGSTVNPDEVEDVEVEVAAVLTVVCQEPTEPTAGPSGPGNGDATPTPAPQLPSTGNPGDFGSEDGIGVLTWALVVASLGGAALGLGTFAFVRNVRPSRRNQ